MNRRSFLKRNLTAISVSLCASTVTATAGDVTVEQLLADPHHYDGKQVSVVGYYILENEESCLFATQEAAKRADFRWSIWVDFRGIADVQARPNQKARIIGRFHHMRDADPKETAWLWTVEPVCKCVAGRNHRQAREMNWRRFLKTNLFGAISANEWLIN